MVAILELNEGYIYAGISKCDKPSSRWGRLWCFFTEDLEISIKISIQECKKNAEDMLK